ncbi:hypothetical protein BGZ96_007975 [Linnemannia gamsii]|uniref:SH3 domain-containing protein n=1 Tax=Linnemannia gamsii TaxID=64522 RepID=A0ABQ7JZ95_9FUNG|nr:hypothetical protein BGZ96_007975 [Linnemannia gamsii]
MLLKGNLVVTRARDAALRNIEPKCIKHQPGSVLDIIGGEELAPSSGNRSTLKTEGAQGNTVSLQQLTNKNIEQCNTQDSYQSYTPEIRTLKVIARAQALFDFPGEDQGDLPFKKDNIINIIEYLNDDWWRGTLGDQLGILPTAYVLKLNPVANGAYPSIKVSITSLHSPIKK